MANSVLAMAIKRLIDVNQQINMMDGEYPEMAYHNGKAKK